MSEEKRGLPSLSMIKRIQTQSPQKIYEMETELIELRAEVERLRTGYLADENGNEYVAVCMLKEKIREQAAQLDTANNLLLSCQGRLNDAQGSDELYVAVNEFLERSK